MASSYSVDAVMSTRDGDGPEANRGRRARGREGGPPSDNAPDLRQGGTMRRWNGWGDERQSGHLPPGAGSFLAQRIGPATKPKDATFDEALAGVPPPRLGGHTVTTDAAERLRHA